MGVFQARQKFAHRFEISFQKETQHPAKAAHLFPGNLMIFVRLQSRVKDILYCGV